jgi:formate hydrogenlyase subunit 3/multisubunit Na+/H+ antiporter MnhD subunit
MVSKDQAIGGAIFIVCLLVAVFYLVTLFFPSWLSTVGISADDADVRFWVIAVPVFIAFVAIMFIGAWIGWTMATTPPPKPIEEITTEMEEKKEEPKVEEPAETKMPETPAEEKMPERKRKSEKPP